MSPNLGFLGEVGQGSQGGQVVIPEVPQSAAGSVGEEGFLVLSDSERCVQLTDDSWCRTTFEPKQEPRRDLVGIEISLRFVGTRKVGQGHGFVDGIAEVICDAFRQPPHLARGIILDSMNQFVDHGGATVFRVATDPVSRDLDVRTVGCGNALEIGVDTNGDIQQWAALDRRHQVGQSGIPFIGDG